MPPSATFGARYGVRIRKRYDAVKRLRQESRKCPYCRHEAVIRKAAGIWYCKHCHTTFTGEAHGYSLKDYVFPVQEADFLQEEETVLEEDVEE